jgi:hypothetical protein
LPRSCCGSAALACYLMGHALFVAGALRRTHSCIHNRQPVLRSDGKARNETVRRHGHHVVSLQFRMRVNQPSVTPSSYVLLAASREASWTITITPSGARTPSKGPEANFTGNVSVEPLFPVNAPSRTSGGSVTFERGARSAWHTHPLGQTLIVTAGTGCGTARRW